MKQFKAKIIVKVEAESKHQVENAIHEMLIHWSSNVTFLGWEAPDINEIEEVVKGD